MSADGIAQGWELDSSCPCGQKGTPAACWREPAWEHLPGEGSAETHGSEDIFHALRLLREVLLQAGIGAASCEMTMLW